MGPVFVVLLWAILLTPVMLIAGLVLCFGGIPLIYRLRGVPPDKRRIGWKSKAVLAVLFCVIAVPALCILGVTASFWHSGDYWRDPGAFDYWRTPLEYPYQLVMIDVPDNGAIEKWEEGDGGSGSLVSNIVQYEKRGPLVVGTTAPDWADPDRDPGWFVFDCRDGKSFQTTSEAQFYAALDSAAFSLPLHLKSVADNHDEYFRNPRDEHIPGVGGG